MAGAALTKSDKLAVKMQRVAAMRVAGKTWEDVSKELGVSRDTLWRWRREYPEWPSMLAALEADELESALTTLSSRAQKAAMVLCEALDDNATKAQLTGANSVLNHLLRRAKLTIEAHREARESQRTPLSGEELVDSLMQDAG